MIGTDKSSADVPSPSNQQRQRTTSRSTPNSCGTKDDESIDTSAQAHHQPDSLHNPHTSMIFQNRYQTTNQTTASSLLQSNILSAGLNTIAQPYSAEICNYGPVYHPHNILHNYNTVYSNDKGMRSPNFSRGVYGGYQGFYSNNGSFRSATLTGTHQNGYDFTPR